ncbi:MAG TPA: metallophosphoesterase [Bryobacteraceae bacterium]|nr:metallophosphoesterase [Bryobacteraceae bacterium]
MATQTTTPAATPAKMFQSRFADLSLFHSALDEVLARKNNNQRPDPSHPSVQGAASVSQLAEQQNLIHANAAALNTQLKGLPAVSDTGVAAYCASLARNLGLAMINGDQALAAHYRQELTAKESVCDPHWIEAVDKYVQFVVTRGKIPYRVWKNIGDFVINDKLHNKARVGIIGDWGTGQPDARAVLQQMARKNLQIAIHLGDIYYSATQFEVDNYFWNIWSGVLNLPASGIASYTLSGNHDMFGGGGPFYGLLDRMGQPASYFCLRNDYWQVIALDTGLHDACPDGSKATYLEQTEIEWLRDKIQNSGGRNTMLLAHHQLYTAYEDIPGYGAVNKNLYQQIGDLLPKVKVWLWGHEHNQVFYKNYCGILARCIGHGAFPIGCDEVPVLKHPEVPVEGYKLTGTPFLDHGYVIADFDGPNMTLSYFVSADESKPIFTETF